MNQKSLVDIYIRNVKGAFFGGFKVPEIYPIGILVPVFHILLLPFTLTFGAGIKSLFDFFLRKEIAETSLSDAKHQIEGMDNVTPLIEEIYKYEPKSNSSKKLINDLTRISDDTQTRYQDKKLELQKEQLGIHKNPNLLNAYKSSYISNLTLDESRQKLLDNYMEENQNQCKSEQLEEEKTIIGDYLSAKHNNGKRMQHIICNFFSSAPTKQPLAPIINNTVEPV